MLQLVIEVAELLGRASVLQTKMVTVCDSWRAQVQELWEGSNRGNEKPPWLMHPWHWSCQRIF